MSFSFPVQAQKSSAHSEPSKSHFACAQRDFDIFMGQLPGDCSAQGVLCGLSRLFCAIACLCCVCWSCVWEDRGSFYLKIKNKFKMKKKKIIEIFRFF